MMSKQTSGTAPPRKQVAHTVQSLIDHLQMLVHSEQVKPTTVIGIACDPEHNETSTMSRSYGLQLSAGYHYDTKATKDPDDPNVIHYEHTDIGVNPYENYRFEDGRKFNSKTKKIEDIKGLKKSTILVITPSH